MSDKHGSWGALVTNMLASWVQVMLRSALMTYAAVLTCRAMGVSI